MTIERLSFPDGYRMDTSKTSNENLEEIIINNLDKMVPLPTGEYDLTPDKFTRALYAHNLIVHPDGRGTFRMLPRGKDVGTREVVDKGLRDFKPGGIVMNLPEDQGIITVAGPTKDDPRIRVFEVIVYLPGKSPRSR